ncbi:MAG: hypothetical protein AB4426_27150 [Xenococcaceae cyanobacterium]
MLKIVQQESQRWKQSYIPKGLKTLLVYNFVILVLILPKLVVRQPNNLNFSPMLIEWQTE